MKGTQGFGKAASRAAVLIAAITTFTLSACSSGGGGDYDSAWVGDIESSVNVSGSVGDGPAINASVTIRKKSGEEIVTVTSDATGNYDIDFSISERHFPLLIDATGGTDIVTNAAPDFVLRGAVLSRHDKVTANINPFSTLAYEIAVDLNGGLTRENLLAAEDIAVSSMNSGLTTLVNNGPMQTVVDSSNVAEIIKSSETLAEVFRRTRDALRGAGQNATADDIVEALSSDLIDTVIEGNGGSRSDARTAAVATIAAAQVNLESMNNELHVNGIDATDAMRRAIEQVVPGASGGTLDELGVTAEMIYQANIGLEAAYAVTGDSRIFDLMQALAGVQPGMDASMIQPLLPPDYRAALSAAVTAVASGDTSVVTTVNQLVRSGGSEGVARNRPPAISGQPATSVQVGSSYEFTPVASDLDGDPLTFSITGRPGWAEFDTSTGRLSGTPQAAGNHDGITITVSDGELTNNIGPFSITVTSNNSTPTLSGTPPATIGVGERYAFQPTVRDPDSTVFRFEISGKPSWADFDVLTGVLTGTPTAADVGLYRSIEISVTDGTSTSNLPQFSIEVVGAGAATGSVTLSWSPPTQNEDGSQLLDLAGYRVYWSRDGGALGPPTTINNASVTRFVVDNLTPGTYEFVATSVNTAGVESRFSNPVTRVVQ
jgi:hypothetical protein